MTLVRACLVALIVSGCAVKGYELGWQSPDRISSLLGTPRDALSDCRAGGGEPSRSVACSGLLADIRALARALPHEVNAPQALGAECRGAVCAYANSYLRRDVGAALIVPIFRKIALRTVRISFARGQDGGWNITTLSVSDQAPPSYGPVRIGG